MTSTVSAIKSPLKLYPYQKAWINDDSRLKIATKARRIGYSFAAGLRLVLRCLEMKHDAIVLSRSERLSVEFIAKSIVPHVNAIGALMQYENGVVPGTEVHKEEVQLEGGAKIVALPANPATARSYEGDIVLDEFAFHLDARKVYEAVTPSITRGYTLEIISTPNGQQGHYFDLAKESGLVDGLAKTKRWSAHKTSLLDAIKQGCADRNGQVLDADEIRLSCFDEEMWQQEYCCQFLSIASQWISPELFEANCDSTGEARTGQPDASFKGLFAGWDVARNKDLSVIWLIEPIGDVSWTRGVVEMRNVPTPDQMQVARSLMPMIRRLSIDKSSMGLTIFEQLEREFGASRVEGVQFTLPNKEALAVHAKRRMEELKARIPESDVIRNSFRSVKKTVTATGQARFDAEHDEKYGHADHWWAYCLAEQSAHNPGDGMLAWLEAEHRKKQEESEAA